MSDKVDQAVEALDKLAQDEEGRKALATIADGFARLLGLRPPQTTIVQNPAPYCPMEPEKTEFEVLMDNAGTKKIDVIKAIREITGLGLKESKDFVEVGTYPKQVKEAVSKEEAQKLKTRLEAAGAAVVIR